MNSRIVRLVACVLAVPMTPVRAQATEPTAEARSAFITERFAHEPDVVRVVRVALEVAGLDPARARSRARRGRRSGLAPTLRFGATRQRGVDQSQSSASASTSDVDRADSLRLEASLSFDLGRLVYGPDETAWSREERAIVDAAAALARDVIETYFRRQRLIIAIELLGETEVENLIALAETNALLEVFTDGNFFRMMTEPRGPP